MAGQVHHLATLLGMMSGRDDIERRTKIGYASCRSLFTTASQARQRSTRRASKKLPPLTIKSKPVMLVIDPTSNTIAQTLSTLPAQKPHGLAIDPKTPIILSRWKRKVVVMDSSTGVCLKSVDIAPGVDQIAFNPGNQRIYCASGQGKLSVLEETLKGAKSLGEAK
jgi:DNA-binding beta-propeller fold protein YncE